jgi:predicted RNA-binding Zn ribbon-like protein
MPPAPPQLPEPLFVGDHLALDFLNTVATVQGERVEWLKGGKDLVRWLEAAGAIDRAVASRLQARTGALRRLDEVAEEARILREWWRGFVKRHAGSVLTRAAVRELDPLNRLLARGESYRQIVVLQENPTDGDSDPAWLGWRLERRWTSSEQLLQPIAEAIGDLICTGDFRLVRACEGSNCTLVFYDRTKAHGRRWCSMAGCGNRAKAAAHRARRRRMKAPRGNRADSP